MLYEVITLPYRCRRLRRSGVAGFHRGHRTVAAGDPVRAAHLNGAFGRHYRVSATAAVPDLYDQRGAARVPAGLP